jgi:hypothetical protein
MCIMRFVSLFALVATASALSGCAGGDGSALSLATSGTTVCGISDPNCATPTPTLTPATPTTPTTPTVNGGNTATFTKGDATIALEKGIVVSTKATPSISKLTLVAATATTPATAKFQIDTKTANNSAWPIAKTMEEYTPGTNASSGLGFGGTALGGTYKEYRAYSRDAAGKGVDEELQVWSFNHSYATQYRDVTGGGAPADRQAWSFGGTKTPAAAMPISGTGIYSGKFGATAKTWNYINRDTSIIDPTDPTKTIDQTIDNNNNWRVWGDSALIADFATGDFNGILSPVEWNAFSSLNDGVGFKTVQAAFNPDPLTRDPNWATFMDNRVILKGTITKSTTAGNSIAGTAVMDPSQGWLTNTDSNAMYAGIFGPNADEITGAFGLDATDPSPLGGYFPINDDRRGFITMSGVFNGQ